MNQSIQQIAELNGQIQTIEISGGQANNLRDHRDQLIVELAQLTSLEVLPREYGVVDISIAGLPVVTGLIHLGVTVKVSSDGTLGVYPAGGSGNRLDLEGGRF